jgi:predicted TIM-barrel fold metal-dependent hydrolase
MPHVGWCIEEFGPGRCMAESNFPIDGMVADYVTVWNALKLLTAGCVRSDRAAVLHDTAMSIYQLSLQALTG